MKIVVGPSAPPMMPIDDASSSPKLKKSVKPSSNAPINAKNTPAWAPAPNSSVLGLDSIGVKSVPAPTPRKISSGNMSVSNPIFWNVRRMPVGSPSPPKRISSPSGRFANMMPIEIGTSNSGSFRFATPTYNNASAITHIATRRGSATIASKPAKTCSAKLEPDMA